MDDLKRGEHPRSSQKRSREDDASPPDTKRAKSDEAAPSSRDDPLVFSLNGISVSTPVRKKVNISIHASTIRLVNPTSKNEEYPPIPLASFQRAFLLPTRGKSKPHWTVAFLSSDVPPPAPKGPAAASAAKDSSATQLVFGLDATLTAPITTSSPDSSETHAKGQPSLPALRAFLAKLPIPAVEPSTALFKSAASAGEAVAGVGAYRGAKEGTLWFFDGGVLWDGKPCEFFALEHLAPAAKGEQFVEGVRTLSATGRTCSVILRRIGGGAETGAKKGKGKLNGSAKDGGDAEEESDQEDEGIDIDFGMVDGREQEPIGRWIKARRHLFGKAVEPPSAPGETAPAVDKGKGKAKSHDANPRAEDTDDEEDDDFAMDSSDDDETSSDSEEDSDASQDGKEEGDASDDETGDEAEGSDEGSDDEIQELDPKHHPLLRPGAMPRMSRAAVEAVVGMVEQDLMGGGKRAAVESDEDEEDELDD